MLGGDLKQLRKANVRRVIHALTTSSTPLSMTALHEKTNLSRPTITSNLQYIDAQGFLITTQDKASVKGGRPPRSFKFNYDNGIIAGIILGFDEITVGIANLAGKLIGSRSCSVNPSDRRHDIALTILRQLVNINAIEWNELLCVTVSIIGEVTPEGRTLHKDWFPELGSNDFFNDFKKEFPCPVLFQNDANLAAIAEYHRLDEENIPQVMLCLNISQAFGAGIIINGRLFSGAHQAAGEMGHDPALGWSKCFDTFQQKRAEYGYTLRGVFEDAKIGNKDAKNIVNSFIHEGLPGVRALICAFDPDLLVVSGEVCRLDNLAATILAKDLVSFLHTKPQIITSNAQGLSVFLGAIHSSAEYVKDQCYGIVR
ncbi:MAG: ROK family protein [Actinomycetaceae bacterium]|nr:ROK family protein [Actinomycetaceae bacterium]